MLSCQGESEIASVFGSGSTRARRQALDDLFHCRRVGRRVRSEIVRTECDGSIGSDDHTWTAATHPTAPCLSGTASRPTSRPYKRRLSKSKLWRHAAKCHYTDIASHA